MKTTMMALIIALGVFAMTATVSAQPNFQGDRFWQDLSDTLP